MFFLNKKNYLLPENNIIPESAFKLVSMSIRLCFTKVEYHNQHSYKKLFRRLNKAERKIFVIQDRPKYELKILKIREKFLKSRLVNMWCDCAEINQNKIIKSFQNYAEEKNKLFKRSH